MAAAADQHYPYPIPNGQPPKKRKLWPWLLAVLGLLFVCIVGVAAASGDSKPTPAPTVSATDEGWRHTTAAATNPPVTEPAAPVVTAKPKPVAPRISGDDVVKVGTDVPAGTYRASRTVTTEDGCYWMKSKDAEGDDIIDNDLPVGRHVQVTVKAGQWFTSSNCPDWIKQ